MNKVLNGLKTAEQETVLRVGSEDNGEDFIVNEVLDYSIDEDEVQLVVNGKKVTAIERDNNFNDDKYVVLIYDNKVGYGFYVKPDGRIYDSTEGLDGQKLSDLLGKEWADKVLGMNEYQRLKVSTQEIEPLDKISNVVLKKFDNGRFPKALIRCKIDGVQQSWRQIPMTQFQAWEAENDPEERNRIAWGLAKEHFAYVFEENRNLLDAPAKGRTR